MDNSARLPGEYDVGAANFGIRIGTAGASTSISESLAGGRRRYGAIFTAALPAASLVTSSVTRTICRVVNCIRSPALSTVSEATQPLVLITLPVCCPASTLGVPPTVPRGVHVG